MDETDYEWGVIHIRTQEVYRTGLDEEAAHRWIIEWTEDGGRPDVFAVIRRPVGRWEAV